MFKKNKLSQVIMVMAASAGSHQLMAQESTDALEEVVVTGIRASLDRAMDIKRDSSGVVDAISAEDIGKFPDTNLAESLQRITGVSIDRVNGEGSEVTIRGFGPEKNMVTLNGRTMPTGNVFGGVSGEGFQATNASRAFSFANLASENVSGVEVYKTSKAHVASGGIGGTINIKTAKPLDNPGFQLSLGTKAVSDTTNRSDDITPEFNSFVSWANEAETFGASLALTHQVRESGRSSVTVNEWFIGTWGEDVLYNSLDGSPEDVFINAPEEGQFYARPADFRYNFADTERERTNGQLTLQFAPNDRFQATVDYLRADNDIEEERSEVTNWLQNGNLETAFTEIEFDDSDIATPVSITEVAASPIVDIGFNQQFRSQENTLESFGLNLEFAVNDSLTLAFDAHDSSMESNPAGPGGSGEIDMGVGSPFVGEKTLDFSGKTPVYNFVTSVPNNALTAADLGSSILRIDGATSGNDVQQFKLDGNWEFDNGRFDFGVETRTVEMEATVSSRVNQTLGGWGVGNAGEFPADMIEAINVQSEFDDYDPSGSPSTAFRGDAVALAQLAVDNLYAGAPAVGTPTDTVCVCVADTFANNDILEEETQALYAQVELSGELGGFPVNFVTGARFETTDVDSTSNVNPISTLVWQSDNDFVLGEAGATETTNEKSSYNNLLPNMDFSIDLTENVVGRFSYSKTIARPSYGDLAIAPSGFATTGASLDGINAQPRATGTNPQLEPEESDNFDLSVEWYYGDSSYVSLGFFEKRIANFIGSGQELETHFGIRDQTNGPRADAAAGDLDAAGLPLNSGTLHAMMVFNEDPDAVLAAAPAGLFPSGEFDGLGTYVNESGDEVSQAQWLSEEAPGNNLSANSDDPLMEFLTSKPLNQEPANLHGFEAAIQHFFGDTGFGVQANYTIVRGDVGFDLLADPNENQFALTGLSDTANLVLLYENYGIQARVAYNWRDQFLTDTNVQSSRNPLFVDEYQQIDFSVGYEVTDQLTVALEGINITDEDTETFMRNKQMVKSLFDLGARYQLGVKYDF